MFWEQSEDDKTEWRIRRVPLVNTDPLLRKQTVRRAYRYKQTHSHTRKHTHTYTYTLTHRLEQAYMHSHEEIMEERNEETIVEGETSA